MATERKFQGLTVVSAVDMSGSVQGTGVLFKAITWGGNIAAVGSGAAGILQDGAKSGQQVTLGWHGEMKYVAAAAIIAGAPICITTSGYFTNPVSGSDIVGKNGEIAATSGSVARGIFDFAQRWQWRPDSYNTDGLFTFNSAVDLSAAAAVGHAIHASSGDYLGDIIASPDGVLEVGATSGGACYATAIGVTRVRAGGVIVQGRELTFAASGWAIQATSGTLVAGKALAASAAGNSGGLVLAAMNLATPHWATTSADVTLF